MSKEIQIIPGCCECGKKMDLRLNPVDENLWMVHGFCMDCKKVYVIALIEGTREPTNNVDYIIDENLKVKVAKKKKNEGRKNRRSQKRK